MCLQLSMMLEAAGAIDRRLGLNPNAVALSSKEWWTKGSFSRSRKGGPSPNLTASGRKVVHEGDDR